VSCPGAKSCIAAGDYRTGIATFTTQAESWNGTAWSVQTLPSSGYTLSSLNAVSCPAATDCVAVGYASNKLSTSHVLAEGWNGKSWTIQKTPALPASSQASLGAGSCPAANSCMALGGYQKSKNGEFLPLIEHWNGVRWTIEPAPLPAHVSLYSLSCPSATSCTGVGERQKCPGCGVVAVAAHWNGSTWTAQRLPVPAGARGHSIILSDLSCPSTRVCKAVGFFHASSKTAQFRDVTIIEAN
jgi:hypothetical protein